MFVSAHLQLSAALPEGWMDIRTVCSHAGFVDWLLLQLSANIPGCTDNHTASKL